jgi:glycosyltransferase involved in cell wall biosynthesis
MNEPDEVVAVAAEDGKRPVLLFVVNIAWFFISHRMELALAAKRKGFAVHVATGVDDQADAQKIRRAGLVLHELPVARGTAGVRTDIAFLIAVVGITRALRPAVLHNVTLKPVVVAGVFSRLLRVPAVVNAVPGLGYAFSARGLRAAARRWVVKTLLALALRNPRSIAILQNPDDLAYLIRAGVVTVNNSVLIRGAGVDLAQFQPTPEPRGSAVVVMVSRMLREKGVYDFVEAARLLRGRRVDARMVLVGDTDDAHGAVPRWQLQQWAASGIVSWCGHSDDVPAVMAAAHIVCLPTFYGEGVPRVLIEAASSARPIVATDVPGVREIVHDGLNGILIEPHRPDSLADAIETLACDAVRRAAMGVQGRRFAEAEFDVTDVISKTIEIYEALLRRSGESLKAAL